MFITITTSKVTPEQSKQVESFLRDFLPRMKQQHGVVAIYHYSRPDKGDESTVVVWESPEAVKSYRESDLVKEAIAYEQKLGLHEATTREGYPLIFSANQNE
jgi:heme-degrading monooxygenase HmoA